MTTFVFFLILLHVSHHASGAVVVDEGGSAVLPCKAPSNLSANAVVEWRRSVTLLTVHIRRNNRDQPSDQHELYSRRTAMHAVAQESRDLSLTLSNAAIFDKGAYVCLVKDGDNRHEEKVELHVNLKDDPITKRLDELRAAVIGVGVVMGIGFTLIGGGGYMLYRKQTKG